jgi:hypothetical protein
MIRLQQSPGADPSASAEIRTGANMIFLAVEVDRAVYRGIPYTAALAELRNARYRCDPAMLDALREFLPSAPEFHRRELLVNQLLPGMTVDQDVVAERSGMIILAKNTVLNDAWVERLVNFKNFQGVKEPIRVRVQGPAAPSVFRRPSGFLNKKSR